MAAGWTRHSERIAATGDVLAHLCGHRARLGVPPARTWVRLGRGWTWLDADLAELPLRQLDFTFFRLPRITTSRKRPAVTRVVSGGFVLSPIPGEEFVEPAHGMAVGHALEDVFEIGERLDVIELCGGDERADGGPADAAAVRAGEQMVLAAERDGPDGAFDRVVVEIDAAVVEEAAEGSSQRASA